ncbi:MAG: hypothetical protein ACRC33_29275 [Gemmataceae bacterium]
MRPLLLCLTLLALSAPRASSADEKFIYPMTVGTTWTYRVGENRYDIKLTKMEKVGKTDCARLEMIVDGKARSFEHLAVTDGVLSRYSFEAKEANPPIPLLKLPPKAGEKWNVESKLDGQVYKGTLESTLEKVKVPAGEYPAVKVAGPDMDLNGAKFSVTYWFASGVGLVKLQSELAGLKVVFELEKVTPGKS